jgi:hypothetical protein
LEGVKASGIGREAGLGGFDAYVEIQTIGLPACQIDTVEVDVR